MLLSHCISNLSVLVSFFDVFFSNWICKTLDGTKFFFRKINQVKFLIQEKLKFTWWSLLYANLFKVTSFVEKVIQSVYLFSEWSRATLQKKTWKSYVSG